MAVVNAGKGARPNSITVKGPVRDGSMVMSIAMGHSVRVLDEVDMLGPGPEEWGAKVQLVSLVRRRLEPAAVNVAVVMLMPDGSYKHRRMQCAGDDLEGALPFLFAASPEALSEGGAPSLPRQVQDQTFETALQALQAAYGADPPALAQGWDTLEDFARLVTDAESGIADDLRPEAERLGPLGAVLVGMGCVMVFAAVVGAGTLLNNWIHLDQIDGDREVVDNGLSLILAIVAAILAWWAAAKLDDRMSRRHLERARRQ
jgi:hypothetical protein